VTLEPKLLNLAGEERRLELCASIHHGILAFVSDVVALLGADLFRLNLPAEETIEGYSALLSSPTRLDAEPFVGVKFENVYSGRDERHVIHPEGPTRGHAGSIWQEGAHALSGTRKSVAPAWAVTAATLSNRLGLLSDGKLRKLQRDPERFFSDSKRPWIRGLRRWVNDQEE
jgi:hypothetical protein